MGILGKYFVQDNFWKPEIKQVCYHTTCDLSCASATADIRNIEGRIYMLLVFAVFVNLHFTLGN